MSHMRLWVAATIIALVVGIGFVLSVPHTRDVPQEQSALSLKTSVPEVAFRDVLKKGVHTLSGSLMAPDACAAVSSAATLSGEASSTEAILLAITLESSSGVCLEVPTRMTFQTTVKASARLPVIVTVNGEIATTTEL
ncbi:MAG: hypothetical protein PHD04_01240 [Candidatus Pacebacteria bacterium]|nr:hypothetical protein [Candidatus Paceibacterota bacterium]